VAIRKEDIETNRRFFENKLSATKQKNDVIHKVKDGVGDFLLLDTRPRGAFTKEHIDGAWCAPLDELQTLAATLPKEKELVTYCWSHY
jgi:rhodanese-related sulfurtransferase